MKAPWLLLVASLMIGCAHPVRFADRAVLWKDPDDRPIAQPALADPAYHWIALRDVAFLPVSRTLALDYGREAINVNAVDETPDSSWWTDRRRLPGQARPRAFSPDEMARGAFGDRPRPKAPFTIIKGKTSGGNVGFIVKDALGRQFVVKLDQPGFIGLSTSTEVVVSRLAWAAGWNVPAEAIVNLQPGDLVLSDKATATAEDGSKVKLDAEKLRRLLARAPVEPDGTIRALMSLWIEGKIIGPYTYAGRRKDDPNDRIPHENRRDLRGYGVFSAWVNNIDTTDINTLDSYIDKHVVHWQQDVGGSFGARPTGTTEYWMGYDTYVSAKRLLASLLSFGIYPRPWEGDEVLARRAREVALWPEIGFFDAEFDPRKWHPIFDNPAFERATERDRYWGAKRVLQIGPEELRAAIAEGHYRPTAAERLFEVLWQRRQAIARAYLPAVAALDYFHVDGERLCWDDLWIETGLGTVDATRYRIDGHEQPARAPRCVSVGGGYRVVTLAARRGKKLGPSMRVHLVDRRIVGIER